MGHYRRGKVVRSKFDSEIGRNVEATKSGINSSESCMQGKPWVSPVFLGFTVILPFVHPDSNRPEGQQPQFPADSFYHGEECSETCRAARPANFRHRDQDGDIPTFPAASDNFKP
jgi:hypothetical protein